MTTIRIRMDTRPAVAADETIDGTWPFEARFMDAPGLHTASTSPLGTSMTTQWRSTGLSSAVQSRSESD